jgi:Rieske Fe-S protein
MKRRSRRPDSFVDAVADNKAMPTGRHDDPDDAEALRVAISLKGAQPGADLPSPEFIAKLRDALASEGASPRRLSRRAMLGTAAAVAAGAAAAGAAGVALDRAVLQSTSPPRASTVLEPVDGEWMKVATDAELTNGSPKQFASAALIGFVTSTDTGVVAVSAACTHQGCILRPNETDARFDCPCHRTAFGHDGHLLFSQLPTRPAPLTRLEVRRQDGDVEVLVPRTV